MVTQWKERMDWFWGPAVAASTRAAKLYSKLICFGQRSRVFCLFPYCCSRVLKQDMSALVCLLIGSQVSLLFIVTNFWMSRTQRRHIRVLLFPRHRRNTVLAKENILQAFLCRSVKHIVAVICSSKFTFLRISPVSIFIFNAAICFLFIFLAFIGLEKLKNPLINRATRNKKEGKQIMKKSFLISWFSIYNMLLNVTNVALACAEIKNAWSFTCALRRSLFRDE